MKKIILLTLLSSATFCFAQNAPIDFEPDGIGADWTWATFEAPEGETNPTFSIEPNISVDATNPSATVAKMDISYPSSESWGQAGCESMHGADLGPFTVTAENSTVSLMFYQVGFASPVALKFATTEGAAFFETIVANDIADQWVEVEFDMSVWIGSTLPGILDQIIFFPSYGPRETGHVVYFDNVVFGDMEVGPSDPMVAAPDPTTDEDLVISVYSDFYMNNTVSNFNFNAFQGDGIISEIQIQGNNTGKIQGLSFYGAEWTAADVSEFDFVHLDYWASTSTAFNFYLIDQTAEIPGGSPAEPRFSFAASGGDATLVQGEWVSIDIPLQHFLDFPSTGFEYDLNDIFQWKFDGNGTLYFDNIYFGKSETISVDNAQAAGFNVFPNPAKDSWTVQSENATVTRVEVYNALGQRVLAFGPNASQFTIDASGLEQGLYIARMQTVEGLSILKLVKD